MIEVEVEDEAWLAALPDCEAETARAAEAALDAAAADITILLTSDDTVRELNARYRGKDAPTNVLSFPAPQSARPHLGDIALTYGVCAAEAEAQGKPLSHHLTHLTVHGVLHLLGYDHESELDADAMEALERTILSRLGVPDPYTHPEDILKANA